MRSLIRKRRKISFQKFLTIFSLVIVLILITILGSNSYLKTKNSIEKQRQDSIQVKMEHISRELNTNFEEVYHLVNNLKTNESVIQYLKDLNNKDLDSIERYDKLQTLQNYLYSVKQDNPLIENILLVMPDGQYSSNKRTIDYIYDGMSMKEEVANHNYFVALGEADNSIHYTDQYIEHRNKSYILQDLNEKMFFGANLETSDGKYPGAVLIFINPESLSNSIFYAENIALFTNSNKMFYKGKQVSEQVTLQFENNKQSENGVFFRNQEVEVYAASIPYYNFKLLYSEPIYLYKDQLRQLWKIIVWTLIFAVIVSIISSGIISNRILRPLYQLLRTIQNYRVREEEVKDSLAGEQRKAITFSLHERFFFYFLISILLPLLIFLCIYYWQTSKIVSQDVQKSFYAAHERLAHMLNNEVRQHELTISHLSLNTSIQNKLNNNYNEEVEQDLMRITQAMEIDKNIGIYSLSNDIFFSSNKQHAAHLDTDYSKLLKESNSKISYFIEKDRFDHIKIILGIPIFSILEFPKKIGYITTDLDNSDLVDSYSQIKGVTYEAFILDNTGKIISHPDPNKVGTFVNQENHDKSISYSTKIGELGWVFVSKYNYQDIQKQVNQLFLSDFYLILFIFIFILIISYGMSKRILKPLGQLNKSFNVFDLNGSHYSVVEKLSGIDEIDLLSRNFNKMMNRMDELIKQTIESNKERIQLKYEKRELQVNALQSQIKPHFLYNTLDNLMFLVESNEIEKSLDMIQSLSKLFRFITNKDQSSLSIRDEMTYTKTYVTIMSYRFSNIECVWSMDEKVLDYQTVKLILQPVIENSIQHGARMTTENIRIEVSCQLKDDMIEFMIRDNAMGIDEDRLLQIQRQLASSSMEQAGIFNVNSRIKLHYGDKYGLNIESIKGEGTIVTIVIPCIQS